MTHPFLIRKSTGRELSEADTLEGAELAIRTHFDEGDLVDGEVAEICHEDERWPIGRAVRTPGGVHFAYTTMSRLYRRGLR